MLEMLGLEPDDLSDEDRWEAMDAVERDVGADDIFELEGAELDRLVAEKLRKILRLGAHKPLRRREPDEFEIDDDDGDDDEDEDEREVGAPFFLPIHLELDPSATPEEVREAIERELRSGRVFKRLVEFFGGFGGEERGKKKRKRRKDAGDSLYV
ncbi:MAG: hypothetical protein Kow0069_16640 [Promethearchaeota archaeon]